MKLTARDKKALMAGAVVTAIVAVFYVVTSLVPSREDLAREVETQKRYLLKQREMIGQKDMYEARLAQYTQRLEKDMTRLLTGTTPAIAGAELQSLVNDLATQSGVEISRKTPRPEQKAQENLVKISVNIDTNCTPDQLVQFLAAVANYGKFLAVDDLVVAGMQLRPQRRIDLRPNITIAGYISAPEAKPEKAENGR